MKQAAPGVREQLDALSNVLGVMSRSPGELQPVLDAVIESAVRLCGADNGSIVRFDGESAHMLASAGPARDREILTEAYAGRPLVRDGSTLTGRVLLAKQTVQIPDAMNDPDYAELSKAVGRKTGDRSLLGVPLIREGDLAGLIILRRKRVVPFTPEQIRLVEAFAAQAVIAIENVRLFNETKAALDRQTATAEVLRVISSSHDDLGPVLEVILASAQQYCGAEDVLIHLREGDDLFSRAHTGPIVGPRPMGMALPLGHGAPPALAVLEKRTVHVIDLQASDEFPVGQHIAREVGFRTALAAPLLANGEGVGAITLRRTDVRPFSDREIELLETFASQAAIAIENVRLFNETKEALAQQTAVADVLASISRSAFDLDTVLSTIVERAAALCRADTGNLRRIDGDELVVVAGYGPVLSIRGAMGSRLPLDGPTLASRSVRELRTLSVDDVSTRPDLPQDGPQSRLAVPILRDGKALGTLVLSNQEVHPFTEREIRLVEVFADQAAIAIENVRLFNETKESLEQQTATAEVLKTISRSVFDLGRVLETVVENAARLSDADLSWLNHRDGDVIRAGARYGRTPELLEFVAGATGVRVGGEIPSGDKVGPMRTVLAGGRTIAIADLAAEPAVFAPMARAVDARSVVFIPLTRAGVGIGTLVLARQSVRPFIAREIELAEAFADQAAIAIENVRLFNETKEALEQQQALSEILEIIAISPSDVQPVLDAVVVASARLTQAESAGIYRSEGDHLLAVAAHEPIQTRIGETVPLSDKARPMVRAVLEGRTVHLPDVRVDSEQHAPPLTRLYVPILTATGPYGVIALGHREVQPFTPRQLTLIETFARQAAIAIENVRLFNETKEALERQTATAEILRLIAGSPADVQPVLDGIARSAAQFCAAENVTVALLHGGQLHGAAAHGPLPGQRDRIWAADRSSVSGRAVVDGRTVHVVDLQAEAEDEYPTGKAIAREFGHRTVLATPLLREGTVIGAFVLRRDEVRAFSPRQIELVETFASQAVIALENVRLFNETKEALEQQTAVSDLLATISRSAFDLPAVLQTIAERAVDLASADAALIFRADGSDLVVVARHPAGHSEYSEGFLQIGGRQPADGDTLPARAVRTLSPHYAEDVRHDPSLPQSGTRTRFAVPIQRDGQALGAIVVTRIEVAPFTPRQRALVETFADQAAIAIENVRLFNETKEALERQTAVSDILKVISASPTDIQPVLSAIAESAVRFCGAEDAVVVLVRGDQLRVAAHHGPIPSFLEAPREDLDWPADRTSVTGRAIVECRTILVDDIQAESDAEYSVGKGLSREPLGGGTLLERTTLATPLIRDGHALGAIMLRRLEVRPFTDKQVELVETFADQAVIAIENVRLFNETKEALQQQTATSEVLQTISRSAFDLQAVLDTVVERAAQLCNAQQAWMRRIEGDRFRLSAYYGASPELRAMFDEMRAQGEYAAIDYTGMGGRAVLERRAIHVLDVTADADLRGASLIIRGGGRTGLAIPMLRDGEPIGAIVIARDRVAPFTEREIDLIETFADQAVIAIENVRLFEEIQDKSRQLEIAGRHKSEFLANMSHELRTPLNAIIGFSEVLLQGMFGELNAKQREYQEDVLSSGRHLLTLINDILDLSKVEAGRVELELSEFSLPAALDNGVTMIRERASRHGIRVAVDCDGVDLIVADERKVKQIVANLLSNAVKFTPDGGQVDVRAIRETDEVRIAVRDTGIGIDEADRERIFEEFQQASRDPERSREGTGLGLALSKRYVELHGGRIWVDSEVGRGSTFTFALPLVPARKEG